MGPGCYGTQQSLPPRSVSSILRAKIVKSMTPEQKTQIIHECVEDKISPTTLARKWQCNADTIRTWVRKAGKQLPKQYKTSVYTAVSYTCDIIATPGNAKQPLDP